MASPKKTSTNDKSKAKGAGSDDASTKQMTEAITSALAEASASASPSTAATAPSEEQRKREQEQVEFLQLLKQMNLAPNDAKPRRQQAKDESDYKFWKTQPVVAINETPQEHGAIDEPKTVDQVRDEPYKLPAGFVWSVLDMKDASQAHELYDLLTNNYVEDDDNMFRFDYSSDFLQWALLPPGYRKDWHVAIRNQKNNKMMAFISGIPVKVRAYENTMEMAEINFLCVHKKLRTKRLAPVLIKEITRRVNKCNIWQAVYTAGVVLPSPVAQCRYFHRALNPKKLVECGFSSLPPRMTMTTLIKRYRLPEKCAIPGFRAMQKKDAGHVCKLVTELLKSYDLVTAYTEAEVAHWMLPRPGVMSSYVVENPDTHEITDFCSFYHLPSTVIGNPKHSLLRAAYSFYMVAKSVTYVQLMTDALIVAKQEGFDVFNALNVMENMQFLEATKFGIGDGDLQYYLYNWRCPRMQPNKIGMILC